MNPLLTKFTLPPFSKIKTEHIVPAMEEVLREAQIGIDALLKIGDKTWLNFAEPLEHIQMKVMHHWSPISHLNAVANTDELRKVYNLILPKLTQFFTNLGQNHTLYTALIDLKEKNDYSEYSAAQKKVIDNAIRDFKLSGVALNDNDKKEFKKIKTKLAELSSKFSENVLDCIHKWEHLIIEKKELLGVPEISLNLFKQNAVDKKLEGYLINLDAPCYQPIMSYCDNRILRKKVYHAYSTIASVSGPHLDKFDNTEIMIDILTCRKKMAQLLNFDNYAQLSIETKMAESAKSVIDFLENLIEASKKQGSAELNEIKQFALENDAIKDFEIWDAAYYSEKLKEKNYAINQNQLRPWFPIEKVLDGLFNITKKLFNIEIRLNAKVDTWHPDVRYYELYNQNKMIASFYLDPYARKKKQGGAWMDECNASFDILNQQQKPVAFLTCNFSPPVGGQPSLLTHDETLTLFHEFGHGLQHMLTKIPYPSISGINGVAWDAVELPSQFMENYCWDKEQLKAFTEHFINKNSLPDDKIEKLLRAKNFSSAMQMLRQLEFSLFDFRLHLEFDSPNFKGVQQLIDEVRSTVSVLQPPHYNKFQNGFSHIFAGGYAAGYYSYKWAEVLSADAFSLFEQKGLFDQATANKFKACILESGGSEDAAVCFKSFMGREPEIDALLRHSGIN